MEQQINVRLIYYKAENRWALAYRIGRRAVSFRYCLFVLGSPQAERGSVRNGNNEGCIEQAIELQEQRKEQ